MAHKANTPAPLASEVTQGQLAHAIGRTARQVSNLTRDKVFVRVPSAEDPKRLVYPWPDSIQRWVEYQVEQRAGKAPSKPESSPVQREREANAAIKEFRLGQLRGEFVLKEAYHEEVTRLGSRIATILDTAPGKHGPRLPGDGPVAEKVAALTAVCRELRAELRRAGYADDDTETTAA